MTSGTGLVLFSHGSLLCGSDDILLYHAENLRRTGKYIAVEPGYLNYCNPPVEEAIARCVAAGASTVVITPYFLIAGKFVTQDLPPRLKSATAQFPDTSFTISRALEDLPVMKIAVEQLLPTARDPREWQEQAIDNVKKKCQLRTDCPLYGSAACRATSGST